MSRLDARWLAAAIPFVIVFVIGCADRASLSEPPAAAPPSRVLMLPFPPRPDPNAYADISAGVDFTCARRNSGAVICWGAILGFGSRANAVLFGPGFDTLRATTISAGAAFACVVNTTSDGVCWGDGEQGQLGNNLGYGPMDAELVAGGHKFVAIGAGTMVTCGMATDGAFCWGRHPDWNNPISNDINAPVQVSTFNSYRNVAVGTEHACATINGFNGVEVDCWGIDSVGQQAIDPTMFSTFVPFTIRSTFPTPVRRVSANDSTTCAELTTGGVQCAGANGEGQLGNGMTGGSIFRPQTVTGGHLFHGVSVGTGHVCALDDQNHAFCWGKNDYGQLGDSSIVQSNVPRAVWGSITFRAIAAGYHHTCGIGTDNGLYCWGANYYGQQGQHSQNNIAWVTPGRVLDPR